MKIIQIIQRKQLRGAEIFACQLANHLVQIGHQVIVVSLFENESSSLPFNGDIVCINAKPTLRYVDVSGWKKLARLITDFNADIVQANAGDTLKYAVFSKLVFAWNAKLVFRNASTISQYLKNGFIKGLNGFLLARVDKIISVSNHSYKDLVRLYPALDSRCVVIPVGIEIGEQEADHSFEVLPRLGYLLHVGGFTFEKNHAGLLKIFKTVLETNSNLELWLVGDGPLRNKITDMATEMGLSKHVRFLGFRSDIPQLMRGARMLLLPSILEGLPGVILEAQYFRVPVIAFDIGGVSEVIKNNETGWLIKAGDDIMFTNAINEVLCSGMVDTIREKAYRQVIGQFKNSDIARRFQQAYVSI